MTWLQSTRRAPLFGAAALTALLAVLALSVEVRGRRAEAKVLRIGSSGSLAAEKSKQREKAALTSLKDFIRTETGMDDEIVQFKDWQELRHQLDDNKVQVGVFQGYEFAWAQEKDAALKPLAVAVDVNLYPVAYVVTRRDDAVKDFAGLKGKTLAMDAEGPRFLKLYVDRQCQANGAKTEAFFTKVLPEDNAEDVLDAVVDGKAQAAVAEQAALEGYRRRKPGRFNQLKEVARSQPFPPVVIAYRDKGLDEATLTKFRDGLLKANQTDRGQQMLTLFRLTGFQAVPNDFPQALARTRKDYPPEGAGQ